jgi:hypothetical protein
MKYRIVEKNDIFIIQKQMQETTGILWWKKTVDVWYCCDIFGLAVYDGRFFARPVADFATLEFAKSQIKQWQKPKKEIIYHELD